MRAFFLTMALCATMVSGYVNLLLVGPVKETYPLAKHYSEFYNVPIFEQSVYFYPRRFIMISEQQKQMEDVFTIDIKDYPHKNKDKNYFISWVKQTFSSS
jgi:hypothetical protein